MPWSQRPRSDVARPRALRARLFAATSNGDVEHDPSASSPAPLGHQDSVVVAPYSMPPSTSLMNDLHPYPQETFEIFLEGSEKPGRQLLTHSGVHRDGGQRRFD
jgi:hypothetical protein